MNECPSLKNCPFFNDKMKDRPATADVYKKKFCLSNYTECARYKVSKAKGKEFVPIDLYPNQIEKVQNLIL